MADSIVVAILALLGNMIATYFSNQKSSALIAYRLEELEKKQDKHNSVIERTYRLEERAELQEERIKEANHRLDDLEKKVENDSSRNHV
jgi:hypothetical protein